MSIWAVMSILTIVLAIVIMLVLIADGIYRAQFAKVLERDLNDKGAFIPKNFTFEVHSANPPGAENIRGLLNNYLEQRDHNGPN